MTDAAERARRPERARARFAGVAFARSLGVAVGDVEPDRAVLRLPHRPEHLNAVGVLNGGASASLLAMAGTLAAWTGVDLAVQYLSAATGEDVVAEGRVLRRGRDVVFLDAALATADGRPICRGLLTYQTARYAGRAPRHHARHAPLPDVATPSPPAPGRLFRGYVEMLGMEPLHAGPGRTRLRMPCTPAHLDEQGRMHAGALASIVDIAAVAASWALIPRRPGARGSTIAMQVSFPGRATAAVIADAHVQQRSEELLFSTVHVTDEASGALVALGQVSYRLLEPWP